MNKTDILNYAQHIKEEIVSNRRHLHKIAETGFELNNTVAFVKQKLNEYGCEYTDCGKNGIVCIIGKKEGKVFLLRADMDALPVEEKTNLDYSCENGNMHACGHDMHTAMLLGAAKILKTYENKLQGQVKLMFQPAEEILSGAKNMIDNGILSSPRVDGAMMIHVLTGLPLKTGTLIVSGESVGAPAADYFTINVQGKGCHGSTPQQGIDSITIACHILLGLQEIPARELGVSDEAVVTVGLLHSGSAGNVIAECADMQGALRAYDDDIRERIKKRIIEISQSIGLAYRGKVCVTFGNGCPTLKNDTELASRIHQYLEDLFGKENVINPQQTGAKSSHSGGSEDFSYVSHEVPSVMVALVAGEKEKGFQYPQHHPKVLYDEEALSIGAATYAYCATKYLES